MKYLRLMAVFCAAFILAGLSQAQEPLQKPPEVLVSDSGVETRTIGPGAPPHTIGLQRHSQTITLDTGVQIYALRYVVARDPDDQQAAIPGEGYIGMPRPAGCNWYAGGFFDLRINGQSIGKRLVHSATGRSAGDRGTADFVFDHDLAVVRVRFVAKAGGDCVYAQALLEPKVEVDSVQLRTRCYPSAFVSDADRHVLTPTRDLSQGERAELEVKTEWWTLYYDSVYDAGYIGSTYRGVGPCAMLWLPEQTGAARFTVAGYGIETVFDLKPALREFRFVFFDYASTKNEAAKADLQDRAGDLLQELAGFAFTDPGLAQWPLAKKQAEIEGVLKALPDDENATAQYEQWTRQLKDHLEKVAAGSAGAIMAEAEAARVIAEWERGLPALKLKALLESI